MKKRSFVAPDPAVLDERYHNSLNVKRNNKKSLRTLQTQSIDFKKEKRSLRIAAPDRSLYKNSLN